MSEQIRKLQEDYSLDNYPYADSKTNHAKLRQLGLLFGQTQAKPAVANPPVEVMSMPITPPKSWVARNKKLIVIAVVVVLVLYLARQN